MQQQLMSIGNLLNIRPIQKATAAESLQYNMEEEGEDDIEDHQISNDSIPFDLPDEEEEDYKKSNKYAAISMPGVSSIG